MRPRWGQKELLPKEESPDRLGQGTLSYFHPEMRCCVFFLKKSLLRVAEEEGGHFAEAATPSEELVGGAL